MTNSYDAFASLELKAWQKKMLRRPSLLGSLSKRLQTQFNSWVPERVHRAITLAIKQMVRDGLLGSKYTTASPLPKADLLTSEEAVRKKIKPNRKTAAKEGGITGAGEILLGLADFPILLAIKIKLLFDMAVLYG